MDSLAIEIKNLSNSELYDRLKYYGIDKGPVTGMIKLFLNKIYLKNLKLIKITLFK